jgi:hypothetical protein
MYPNTVLSAWQLTIIAVVAVTTLGIWLGAVYLAAREPRGRDQAAAGSAPGAAVADPGSRSPAASADREPERPPADRAVA